MHTRYNRKRHNALRERGKRMANARWAIDRARREAEMPARIRELEEIAIQNLPHKEGDILGVFQWTDFRTGKVRRWTIRIGDRIDRITAESNGKITKSHGWTWLLNHLRTKIVNG